MREAFFFSAFRSVHSIQFYVSFILIWKKQQKEKETLFLLFPRFHWFDALFMVAFTVVFLDAFIRLTLWIFCLHFMHRTQRHGHRLVSVSFVVGVLFARSLHCLFTFWHWRSCCLLTFWHASAFQEALTFGQRQCALVTQSNRLLTYWSISFDFWLFLSMNLFSLVSSFSWAKENQSRRKLFLFFFVNAIFFLYISLRLFHFASVYFIFVFAF